MPTARTRKPPPPRADAEPDEIPEVERVPRSPKLTKLETQIAAIYIMLGGAMSVVPPQVAGERIRLVGRSLSMHSNEIAEAWVDLCEEDKRVQRAWESLTGFSAWGKVVGRHLEAIGDETPAMPRSRDRQQPQEAPSGGFDDLAAMRAIGDFVAQMQAEARQDQPGGNGEPPPPTEEQVRRAMAEQQRQQQRPVRQQQQQPMPVPPQQAPAMGSTRRPVGMPTPADLGVEIGGGQEEFPSSGAENVRG